MSTQKTYLDELAEDINFRAEVVLADLAMDLAEKIRQLRAEKNMSQKELAEKIKTKQSQISKLENTAEAHFTLKTLAKLAEALDCELSINLAKKADALYNKKNKDLRIQNCSATREAKKILTPQVTRVA